MVPDLLLKNSHQVNTTYSMYTMTPYKNWRGNTFCNCVQKIRMCEKSARLVWGGGEGYEDIEGVAGGSHLILFFQVIVPNNIY